MVTNPIPHLNNCLRHELLSDVFLYWRKGRMNMIPLYNIRNLLLKFMYYFLYYKIYSYFFCYLKI